MADLASPPVHRVWPDWFDHTQAGGFHCDTCKGWSDFRLAHLGLGQRGGRGHWTAGTRRVPFLVICLSVTPPYVNLLVLRFCFRTSSSVWRCFWQPSLITTASPTSRTFRKQRKAPASTLFWPCGTCQTFGPTSRSKCATLVSQRCASSGVVCRWGQVVI